MKNKSDQQSFNSTDKNKKKTSKEDTLKYISFEIYLSDNKIKTSEFVKSCNYFNKKFDDEINLIKLENFEVKKSEYLERILDVTPKINVQKNRIIGKKIVAAIFGRYGIPTDAEFPPSYKLSEEFISKQQKYITDQYVILKSAKEYKTSDKDDIRNTEQAILFEFKLFRLLVLFIGNSSWFTSTLLIKGLKGFQDLNSITSEYSYNKGIVALFQSQKSSLQLTAIINDISKLLTQTKNDVSEQRQITDNLQFVLRKNEEIRSAMDSEITRLSEELSDTKSHLAQQKQERQSDQRITSVGQSEFKARVQKSISLLIRDEINLITEMLSDGNEQHTRVLKHVNSLKKKLEDLKSWTSSSD